MQLRTHPTTSKPSYESYCTARTRRQRAALLYNGTASSSSRQVTLEDLAPTPPADKATAGKDAQQGEGSELRTGDVRKKLKAAQASSKNTSKGFGSKPSSAPTAGNPSSGPSSSASNGMSAEVLAEVVRYNCWGIEYADLGAAATRGEPSRSYVGEGCRCLARGLAVVIAAAAPAAASPAPALAAPDLFLLL